MQIHQQTEQLLKFLQMTKDANDTRSQAAKLEYAVKKVPRERKLEVLRDWRCGIVAIPADCKSVLLRGFGGSSPPVATSFTVREH